MNGGDMGKLCPAKQSEVPRHGLLFSKATLHPSHSFLQIGRNMLYVKKHGNFRGETEGFCGLLDSLVGLNLLNYAMQSSPALFAALAVAGLVVLSPSNALAQSTPECPAIKATVLKPSAISEAEVLAAQKGWGEALVAISTTYDKNEKDGKYDQAAAKELAGKVIDSAYGYNIGPVLFKPTLTTVPQTFRTTRAGALAYFVGGDPAFPGDTGFALKGWRKVNICNAAIFIDQDSASTMGKVMITNKKGEVTTVDKTWTFVKDASGKLRIMVHHSSLPYVAAKG